MNQSTFTFHSLTPDLIIDSLESIGLRVDSGLTELNSYENRVYQFSDEDRQRYVAKYYRPQRWTKEQILEEHQFVQQLVSDEVPAVAPLTLNQTTLHRCCDHDSNDYFFTVYPSMGGRQYEMDNVDQLEWVGRFLGRIHQVGQQSTFQHRPTMTLDEYLYEPKEIILASSLVERTLLSDLRSVLERLIAEVEKHWHTDWSTIRLHGDCHAGNILWRDGPLFVDFDDSRNGPAIQDLWMLLHGERQEQLIQLDILLEAYQEFADFDHQQLALIEPLRAMRMVYYLAWIIKRWQDPAFPKNFTWITDSNFWYTQRSLFEEQIKALQAPPLKLMLA